MRILGLTIMLITLSNPALADWNVCIERASILPVKITGKQWDGPGRRVKPSDMAKALMLLKVAPIKAVSALAPFATGGRPDPRAFLYVNNQLVLKTRKVPNEHRPNWNGACVRLTLKQANSKIKVVLRDWDISQHDAIGTVLFERGFSDVDMMAGKWEGRGTVDDGLASLTLTFQQVPDRR